MLNQVVLVGRLTEKPTKEMEGEKVFCKITLAVSRSFKNMEGVYETDMIPCILWNGVAEQTTEYCKKGDLVGVKGRLQIVNEKLTLVAEKITFLSSKSE